MCRRVLLQDGAHHGQDRGQQFACAACCTMLCDRSSGKMKTRAARSSKASKLGKFNLHTTQCLMKCEETPRRRIPNAWNLATRHAAARESHRINPGALLRL